MRLMLQFHDKKIQFVRIIKFPGMNPVTPFKKAALIYPQKYFPGTAEVLGKKNGYFRKKIFSPPVWAHKGNSVFFQNDLIRIGAGNKSVPGCVGGYHRDQYKKRDILIVGNHIQ
ncbi:MAG: hypothetical protein LBC31_11345 [Treponema sp.]|nr:hypothetical protein [Treponema sp.]